MAAPGAVVAAPSVEVIYVGGWDCPSCIAWKRNDKPGWMASPEFKRVTWIEVEAPHLKEAYDDLYWPPDLRMIRDQLPKKAGTPRFLVVKKGKIVSNQFGSGHFKDKTIAAVKKALGTV